MVSDSHANGASFDTLFRVTTEKAEVEQEPQKTKQARNLKSSAFTRMAHQHALLDVTTENLK